MSGQGIGEGDIVEIPGDIGAICIRKRETNNKWANLAEIMGG